LIVRGYLRRRRSPRLRMSRVRELAALPQGMRVWLEPALVAARVVSVLLMGLALMGPQSIHARDVTEVQGIDIVLTLDLSLSMQAADIRPNRFAATQAVVDDFIAKRPNDRIGAVIFGRDAHTLLPLTTDHEALRTMITELQLGVIEGRGTAIGNGIGVALNRLRHSDAKSKVVILLTDGDSNSGNVSPLQAADFAKTLGVKVYTILMGRSDNAPVQSGLDLFGRPLFDKGNFPVNPELLKKVAALTGGEAFQVADREALERSFHTILDRLQKSQIEDAGRVYGELFPAFLGPALLLLLLEIFAANLLQRRWP
ncbi:MAG TPA: VWA domain-containing protein, partial [Polyangiales bacterium]